MREKINEHDGRSQEQPQLQLWTPKHAKYGHLPLEKSKNDEKNHQNNPFMNGSLIQLKLFRSDSTQVRPN